MITQDGFGYSEREKELNWAAEYAKRKLTKHREQKPIDHPDGSVTEAKLADGAVSTRTIADDAVTLNKLGADVAGKFTDLNGRIDTEVEERKTADGELNDALEAEKERLSTEITQRIKECLSVARIKVSELYTDSNILMDFSEETLQKDFVLVHNDTSYTITEFREHDDYAGILSEPILAGETRLCKIFSLGHGGAEPENGFVWVLPSKDIAAELRKQLNAETAERKEEAEEKQEAIDDNTSKIEEVNNKLRTVKVTEAEVANNEADEAYDGTILTQIPILSENTSSQIKIRRERDVEHKYPNAVNPDTGGEVNNADIFKENLSGTINYLDYGDNYEFNVINPMSVPANSTVYFRLLKKCVAAIDSYNSTPGEVEIIDVYTWHDAIYIKTDSAADWTRMASMSDVSNADNALNEKLASSTTEHQIFVQCNEDHDELKLQAAIDNAPENSVIYPVGTCVITNDSTPSGGDVLKIKQNRTLDGRYCNSMIFVNSNPASNQRIFRLLQFAKMKNIDFCEDTETVTQDTINPGVIYSIAAMCEVSNCSFTNLKDTNTSNNALIFLHQETTVFEGNTISNCLLLPSNTSNARINIRSMVRIESNTFKNINSSGSVVFNGYLGINLEGTVCNNCFETINLNGAILKLGGRVCGNSFKDIMDTQYAFSGNVVANKFSEQFLSVGPSTLIVLSNWSHFTDNFIRSIQLADDEMTVISSGVDCKISDNLINISDGFNDFCGINATDQTQVHHNSIFVPNNYISNEQCNVFDGTNSAVITDNITNATSLGTFDDTCVVERNITAEVSA